MTRYHEESFKLDDGHPLLCEPDTGGLDPGCCMRTVSDQTLKPSETKTKGNEQTHYHLQYLAYPED